MTTLRRRGLQIDDPLGPGRSAAPTASTDEPPRTDQSRRPPRERKTRRPTTRRPAERRANPRPPVPLAAHRGAPAFGASSPAAGSRPYSQPRECGGSGAGSPGVGSFRLPHELLAELGDTARELGLPIGMIVTAAITQLLDQPQSRSRRSSTGPTTPVSTGAGAPDAVRPIPRAEDEHGQVLNQIARRRSPPRCCGGRPRHVAVCRRSAGSRGSFPCK